MNDDPLAAFPQCRCPVPTVTGTAPRHCVGPKGHVGVCSPFESVWLKRVMGEDRPVPGWHDGYHVVEALAKHLFGQEMPRNDGLVPIWNKDHPFAPWFRAKAESYVWVIQEALTNAPGAPGSIGPHLFIPDVNAPTCCALCHKAHAG